MRRACSLFLLFLLPLSIATPLVSVARGQSAASNPFTVDSMLRVLNVNVGDLTDDGRWIAATASSLMDGIGIDNYRFGDPTYTAPELSDVWVIDTLSGKAQKAFPDKRQVRSLKWSRDGSLLAILIMKGDLFQPAIWERASGKLRLIDLPKGSCIAENTDLFWFGDGSSVIHWSADSSSLILPFRSEDSRKKQRKQFEYETRGPIVVHSSKEPFLAWDDLRRAPLARRLMAYEIKSGAYREILPETKLKSYKITDDGSSLIYWEDISKKTDYENIFGSDCQVQRRPLAGGAAQTVIKSTRGLNIIWSRDDRRYAYSKEGNIFCGSIDHSEPRQLTGKKEAAGSAAEKPKEEESDKEKEEKEKERFTAIKLNTRGDKLVASNKEGLWIIDTESGSKEMFLKMPEENKEATRYEVIDWNPDGDSLFLSYSSRTRWERGVTRFDLKSKKLLELTKDARLYSGFRLSRDGKVITYLSSEGNRPSDIFAADSDFKNARRLTDLNPQLGQLRLGTTQLISYLDTDGNKMHGVLYHPVGYEKGKSYPTVFNLYEHFFDDIFDGTIAVLTAAGYAVMQPSVELETGYPGESWIKGVTAAANKLIEMGIADPDRLGIQGTSYGGYAVNLLITQTHRFKAAVNISGKVNMISFYTDSPRLGVRNIHAPEKSQDRLGATLWQQPQKYIQQSAIMFADRIKTPLLLMTGEQDHNVPARQAMEIYYALRRLGKEVEWVSYINGGHGMPTSTVEEVKDYHKRLLEWYDGHLRTNGKKDDQNAQQ
jgi:dipeptidyl aminopeptidase/acylaminoacyl peptidase